MGDGPMIIESILRSKGGEVRTTEPDATVAKTLHRMRHERIGALVVSEDKMGIAGIVSDRGIMDAMADRGVEVLGKRVGSVMTGDVVTCSRHDRVRGVMASGAAGASAARHSAVSAPWTSAWRTLARSAWCWPSNPCSGTPRSRAVSPRPGRPAAVTPGPTCSSTSTTTPAATPIGRGSLPLAPRLATSAGP
jgi:hypothetical protein